MLAEMIFLDRLARAREDLGKLLSRYARTTLESAPDRFGLQARDINIDKIGIGAADGCATAAIFRFGRVIKINIFGEALFGATQLNKRLGLRNIFHSPN